MHTDSESQQQCYGCGAEVALGMRVCPVCGRKQTRTCYCGAEIPVTAATCPECGADWSASRRVRRKSKSKHIDWRQLAKFSVIGALCTALAAAGLNAIITALARRSLDYGEPLSASFSQRLSLALTTMYGAVATVAARLAEHGAGATALLGILVLGAGVGAIAYLVREGLWTRWRRRSSSNVKRKRSSSTTDKAD